VRVFLWSSGDRPDDSSDQSISKKAFVRHPRTASDCLFSIYKFRLRFGPCPIKAMPTAAQERTFIRLIQGFEGKTGYENAETAVSDQP
jgi:hypothetical protein